jgi:hypothetical protein
MLRSKRNVKRASHSDGYRCSHYRETITNDERFGNAFTCAELDCDGSTSSSATFTSPSGYNGLALGLRFAPPPRRHLIHIHIRSCRPKEEDL